MTIYSPQPPVSAPHRARAGGYRHVQMVDAPLWLPQRRAPRSLSTAAKVNGLSYERHTIADLSTILSARSDYTEILCNLLANESYSHSNLSMDPTAPSLPLIIPNAWFQYQTTKNEIKHLCSPDVLIIFYTPVSIDSGNSPTNHPVSIGTDYPSSGKVSIESIGSGNDPSGKVSTNIGFIKNANSISTDHFDRFNKSLSKEKKKITNNKFPNSNVDSISFSSTILIIVCEIKLTYTPNAIKKLRSLYLPIVSKYFGNRLILPLIICKNLTPTAPPHSSSISQALKTPIPLITHSNNFNFII